MFRPEYVRVDPTLANNGGFNSFSVEVEQGGSLELDPEESESWTAGFAYEQDFSNDFDLSIGMTYYEIDITNTVIQPSTGFIIGDCYGDEAGTGASVVKIQTPFASFSATPHDVV